MNLGQLLGEREVYGLEWKPDGVRSLKPEPEKTGRAAVMITFIKDRVVDRSPYSPSAALAIRSGSVQAYGIGIEDDDEDDGKAAQEPETLLASRRLAAPVETAKVHQPVERKPRGPAIGDGKTTLFRVPATADANYYRAMPMKEGILSLLKSNPGRTLFDMAKTTGYARNSITTLLCILRSRKLIEHAGPRGSFRYYIYGEAP